MRTTLLVAMTSLALLASGCSRPGAATASDSTKAPTLGACRTLKANDLAHPTNDSDPVGCTKDHTAQTFLVGSLPASTGTSYDDRRHGAYVYTTCTAAMARFLGADESLAMRSQLSWAWFRASSDGWKKGARWFRCDIVGGTATSASLRTLPTTTKGLFSGRPDDDWLTCARGGTVSTAKKLPCSQPHDWRAVTTIKLGQPKDAYPGDRISEVRSRDYCSDSIGAWLNYPVTDYDYGYTYFHEAEWKAGNRRAICWAKTDK